MILLPPCLITERIMAINPSTFPQRPIPTPAPRKATTDQKLPPHDPPPPVSHHGENHGDQSEPVPSKAHSQHRTPQGNHRTKSSHADPHDHRSHRRYKHHSHFHWPWEHRK